MLNIIFAELADEIMKDMIKKHQEEKSRRHPLLKPIEDEIERLGNIEQEVKDRLVTLRQMHQWISELFESKKEPEVSEENHAGKASDESAQTKMPVEPEPIQPIDQEASKPTSKRGRKSQEKVEVEFKRLSVHRATGNPRLDSLEMALHDALERLNNTRMAYHFMTIKEVRLALSELYKSWDKPENERIAELEAGLKDAVDKLSVNPSAINSKIMPEIWGDLIVALKNDNN